MTILGKFNKLLKILAGVLASIIRQPKLSLNILGQLPFAIRGAIYTQYLNSDLGEINSSLTQVHHVAKDSTNPLEDYFNSHETGRGIHKWNHYFDIYHHHFSKFIGREVNILEIGVYSGGSLEMWRHYFGPKCHVYGLDIEDACKSYENEYTDIFVGDQEDRNFLKELMHRIPAIDIVIDDGGHKPEQQIASLEELLPYIRPGGVYLCEDIHGEYKGFSGYMHGLVNMLNTFRYAYPELSINPTNFQAWIRSIHSYPFVTVLEKAEFATNQFIAPKRGTEWAPFIP